MAGVLVDVQCYLERLGVPDAGGPSLEGLRMLHEQHHLSVPFENLDIHRGVEIVLDEDRILRKIVLERRGGFCYELNGAFGWLLRELGYRVTTLAAEVARKEGGFGIPFDHMTLLVDLGERWLADVGFGDSFRSPLELVEGREVEQGGDVYRFRSEGPWWILERRVAAEPDFGPQYRFTLEPRELADFTSGCLYHQSSPQSSFTRGTICTRALPRGRVTLHPDRLVTTIDGSRIEHPIGSRREWEELLWKNFGLQ